MPDNIPKRLTNFLKYVIPAIILLGIILRIAVWLQNRNLIIDEANVTRNIFERGFVRLLKPLYYEQYAPPVFLWITKLSSLLFGFGEPYLRLYALLTGLSAVVVYAMLLKELLPLRSVWYALFLFATAHIMLRYSSEVKQYMGDVLIVQTLLLMALKVKAEEWETRRFALLWIVTGSIAIWTSMPSVFALAGVGLYYFAGAYHTKDRAGMRAVVTCSVVWIAQFGLYYWIILSPQANSTYLQNFHHYYFLIATPNSAKDWLLNWVNISALFRTFGNNNPVPLNIVFNVALLLFGIFFLIRNHFAKALLLLVPIMVMFFASALKQYSLIPRVSLFVIPLLLLVISFGAEQLFRLNNRVLSFTVQVAFLLYAFNGNSISMLWKPYKAEQLTEGLEVMKQHHIPPADILIYHSSVPALIYYTEIHPGRARWQFAKEADRMVWSVNYDSLAHVMKHVWQIDRPFGFIATNITAAEDSLKYNAFSRHFRTRFSIRQDYLRAYIFKADDLPQQPVVP